MLDQLVERYPAVKPIVPDIQRACDAICACYEQGGKVLACGNGGSAADAEHIVGELMKGFLLKRPLPAAEREKLAAAGGADGEMIAGQLQGALAALSLVTSVALSTAFANDVNADLSYAQQVHGLGKPGDVFIGISTSGNAKNVHYAAIAAKARGMTVIGFTGGTGGRLKNVSDIAIVAPSNVTYQIQELHLPIYHCLCIMVEEHFFGKQL
jgi:D-sedoheptulose 7-phosphate isomerase